LLVTLEDQHSSVRSAAFSPDGNKVVSVAAEGSAKVSDATTGKALFDLKGRRAEIKDVSFSPDGSLLLALTAKGYCRVWDAQNGEHLADLRASTGPLGSPIFLSGASRIAATAGPAIKVWDARTGQELVTLDAPAAEARRLTVSEDGVRLAGAATDGSVRIWEGLPRAEAFEFAAGMQAISAAFSPKANHLAVCDSVGAVRAWDLTTREEIFYRKGGGSGNWGVDFSADGARMIISRIDTRPKIGGKPYEFDKSIVRMAWDLASEAEVAAREDDAPDPASNRGGETRSRDGSLVATIEGNTIVVRRTVEAVERQRAKEANEAASLRWQLARAEEADKAGDAAVARFHREHLLPLLDNFVAAHPGFPGSWLARGNCLLRLGRIDRALRDYANPAVGLFANSSTRARHARALLATGNADAYRRLMSNWNSETTDAAMVSVLSPEPLPAQPAMLAAAFHSVINHRQPAAVRVVGGLLLRAGRVDESVRALRMSLALRGDGGPPVEEALLALACRQLKRPVEARDWLARASARLDERKTLTAAGDWVGGGAAGIWYLLRPRIPLVDPWIDPLEWDSWFDADILRREGEKLIGQ
jgi:tetratricopeptide (TPR) repeat protein